jgi:hypothetical protein
MNTRFTLLLLAGLILSPLLTRANNPGQKIRAMSNNLTLYKASDSNFQYVGRIDFSNPDAPRFWAPGVYITAKFLGTSCDVLINDQVLWGKSHNYIEIVVDGKAIRLKLKEKENIIHAAENLKDGEHTILICKNTETNIGYLEFVGLRCQRLLQPDAKPTRKIEFYGNSITCGTGMDMSAVPCGAKGADWHDQHNAYMSYGAQTARRLNAQWQLTSYSGIGLIHSCCNLDFVMPDVYDRLNLTKNGTEWDFSRYKPDVVTICLGQNDGIQDSVAFCSAYVSFIGKLRAKYHDAQIVCLTSPMADPALMAKLKFYISGIVAYVNNQGDNKVSKFFFSRRYSNGCDTHPDLEEHGLISGELTAYLQKLMNW